MPRRALAAVAAAAALLNSCATAYETVDGNSDKLQWQGRFFDNDGAPWRSFSWPGVRFSFNVTGASYATMAVQSNNTLTRMKVWVDGVEAAWLWVGDAITGGPYVLFQGLSANDPHAVTVYNTAEPAFQGSNNFYQKPTLVSVTTDGRFQPAPLPLSRALEFVGDSLTAGFGANGLAPCPGTILMEDNSVTWGNLLCGNFSANCSIVAWSGIGVYENSGGFGTPRMPELYTRTLGANPEAVRDGGAALRRRRNRHRHSPAIARARATLTLRCATSAPTRSQRPLTLPLAHNVRSHCPALCCSNGTSPVLFLTQSS
jgi:hypothetical protein